MYAGDQTMYVCMYVCIYIYLNDKKLQRVIFELNVIVKTYNTETPTTD